MPDPATGESYSKHEGGKPNFLMAVLMTAVAFILFFIVALFLLHHSGRHFLPNRHRDHEPHAFLQFQGLRSSPTHS